MQVNSDWVHKTSSFNDWARHNCYRLGLTDATIGTFAQSIIAAPAIGLTDIRVVTLRRTKVYCHAWRAEGDWHVETLKASKALRSIAHSARTGEHCWHDGRGDRHEGYSEHQITAPDPACIHDLKRRTINVFHFAGGGTVKMRECRRCHGHVDASMADHPNGRHVFTGRPDAEGFVKCRHCDLSIHAGGPAMILGGTPAYLL